MAQFINFIPSANQENVARTTLISFSVFDDGYAGQTSTLNATINATPAIINGAFVNGYNGSILSSITKIVVGIYPKSPNYLPRAEKIDVDLNILNSNNELISQSYSFYTSGYGEVEDSVGSSFSRACSSEVPSFPQSDLGLSFVRDDGIGTEATLTWSEATPKNENNIVFYNVYYSTNRDSVYDGYPDFITDETEIVIGGLSPGDQYFFGVHAVEISPLSFTLSGLKQRGIGLYEYPTGTLSSSVSTADLTISVNSTIGFPNFGLIIINDEICKYSSKTTISFLISSRGYGASMAESHESGSLIRLYINKEEGNTFIVQSTQTFQKPNYSLTYSLKDGYETDYQDGYDGYAAEDGYLRYKQENFDNMTTPGQNNDASGGFHRLDYCSWRSVSPQSVMKGQCSHSYFGGAQVRIDADGNKHLVKESNINTHMLQREEALLETTGEPFVLLRRMWTGIRCHCFMLRREHPDSRCPSCFTPDTLINTKRGFIPIKDVKIGEEVLSDDGLFHEVLNVMERNYDGYMCKINTYTTNPIMVTPEHPFLTMIDNHGTIVGCGPSCNAFIQNGDGAIRHASPRLLKSGRWWARVTDLSGNRVSLGTFKEKNDAELAIKNYYQINIKPLHRLDWKNAEELVAGDWLENKWSNGIENIEKITIPKEFKKQTILGSQRNGIEEFNIDGEFLWILGMYIAEGSSGSRHINFSLHKDEIKFQTRIIKYFKDLGFNGSVRKASKNGVSVEINSTTLSSWFPSLVGSRCYNKIIPHFLMNLPKDKIIHIIQGIYDGDGNKSCNEIGQTSKILALQIMEILNRLGKQPNLRFQVSKSKTPKGNERKLCYIVSWKEETLIRANRKNRWDFKEELLTRIKTISKEYYSGKVYNLEVADRHTYVVENVVVHNCFGTSFVQGYVQFFNSRRSDRRILVRVDPATDDLQILDRGLEPDYQPDAWTMAYPAIKDRDVLVRFNEDNSQEYIYEILNVNRVRAMFGQSGAQKFKMQRFPKTDQIYQFPILRDTSPYPGNATTSSNFAPGIISHNHSIIVPDGTSLITYTGATLVSQNHNHIIFNGVVQNILGHTHTL